MGPIIYAMFGGNKIFAYVLDSEKALVRSQFISGTHALTVALFAFLRPGDTLLSITGKPYDTLDNVIGISGDNKSSLKSFGVKHMQVDLINDEFEEMFKTNGYEIRLFSYKSWYS